ASITPSFIPGDKATTRADWEYATLSSQRAMRISTGLRSAPTAMGISGHKSRTSNTIGTRRKSFTARAGITTVRGVLVAKTTFGRVLIPTYDAQIANNTNDSTRRKLLID